jgi:hypothetical protein
VSISVAVILWVILGVASTWNPLKLVEGADGRPSTSKFQFWLWTAVIVPTFCGLYAIQMKALGYSSVENEWPRNLLIVMGMSVVTTAAAKGTGKDIGAEQLGRTNLSDFSGRQWLSGSVKNSDARMDYDRCRRLHDCDS